MSEQQILGIIYGIVMLVLVVWSLATDSSKPMTDYERNYYSPQGAKLREAMKEVYGETYSRIYYPKP